MSDLIVFPSEALLLGLCVGEYEQIHEHEDKDGIDCGLNSDDLRFMRILRVRFFPFYAEGDGKWKVDSLSEYEIPDDVKWLPLQDDSQIGCISPHDRVLYVRSAEGEYHRKTWDPWRDRSVAGRLAEELAKNLSLFVCDVLDFLQSGTDKLSYEAAFATNRDALNDFFTNSEDSEDLYDERTDAFYSPVGKENPVAVVETIEKIVHRNGYEEIFKIGRYFGQLLVLLPRFSDNSYLSDEKKIEEEKLASKSQETIDQLMSSMQNFDHLPFDLALERLRSVVTWDYLELDMICLDSRRNTMTMLHWIAFAQVFLAINVKDASLRQQDAEKVTPRSFVRFDDSPDKIRKHLTRAENYLNRTKSDEEATDIICQAKDAVEALSRKFWPDEFGNEYGKTGLGRVLIDKRRSTNPNESRFASIAATLYYSYRNPATHDLDSFQCTRREAKFFLSGLQAMLDLLESEQD